jgi:hypothetical protein
MLQVAQGVPSMLGRQVKALYGITCLGHNFTQVRMKDPALPQCGFKAAPSVVHAI